MVRAVRTVGEVGLEVLRVVPTPSEFRDGPEAISGTGVTREGE